MADIADRANEQMDYLLQVALCRRAQPSEGVGLEDCEDCGEPIPVLRRETLAGCRTCIDCQTKRERRHG